MIACTSMFCGTCPQCMQGLAPPLHQPGRVPAPQGCDRPASRVAATPLAQFADLSGFAEMMLRARAGRGRASTTTCPSTGPRSSAAASPPVSAPRSTRPGSPRRRRWPCSAAAAWANSVIQGARLAGARQIIAIDIVPHKLETARHFGATDVLLVHRRGPGEGHQAAERRRRGLRLRRRRQRRPSRPSACTPRAPWAGRASSGAIPTGQTARAAARATSTWRRCSPGRSWAPTGSTSTPRTTSSSTARGSSTSTP